MAVTTGYYYNGTDIGTIFGAKGASTAAATGMKVNGTDLNALLLAHADGIDIGFNTGITVAGNDLRNIFASPQTALPINGQTFSAASQSGTVSTASSYTFTANTSGWAISGSSSSGGAVTPGTSGAIPSGATQVQYTTSVASSAGTNSTTNTTSAGRQPLTSTQTVTVGATGTPSTVDSHIWLNVTITFYNASNAAISTTNIQMRASAVGSS